MLKTGPTQPFWQKRPVFSDRPQIELEHKAINDFCKILVTQIFVIYQNELQPVQLKFHVTFGGLYDMAATQSSSLNPPANKSS